MLKNIILVTVIFLASCAHDTERVGLVPEPAGVRVPTSAKGTLEVITDEVLEKINPVGKDKVIKFSILKDTNGKFSRLVLQDASFGFHHDYLTTTPEFKGLTHKEIEALTYKKSEKRKAYIGVLSIDYRWFSDMDTPSQTGFYIMSDELPNIELLSDFRNLINEKLKISQTADRFYPLSHQEAEAIGKRGLFNQLNLELILPAKEKKMAYTDGWNIGRVLTIKNQSELEKALQQNAIKNNTILLIAEALRDLPPCGGVISSVTLTPSSHLTLLAQMYNIPLVYEEYAFEKYSNFNGMTVFLSSSLENRNNFQFYSNLSDDEIKLLNPAKLKKNIKIDIDEKTNLITEVVKLKNNQVNAYGGKAIKFGLLRRVVPENTRSVAAAIPIYYYKNFLRTAVVSQVSLEKIIQNELQTLNLESNYQQVSAVAKNIREKFKLAEIDPNFFTNIQKQLITTLAIDENVSSEVRLKLRSSSNVEDGAEFNGAGLYESEGVCLIHCKKNDFEKGIRKVWGSLYTERGLWARRQFSVDESKVGMAILTHSPFKNELFNGVARFKQKIYTDNGRPYIVESSEFSSAQGEDDSVTNATGEASAELATYQNNSFSIIKPFKGLPPSRSLMGLDHYKTIAGLMSKIAKDWPDKINDKKNDFEIEVEWKVMLEAQGEKVYIKQVREVPKLAKINIPDGSERLWLTGDVLEIKGPGHGIFDPILGLYRVRDLKLNLKAFSENDLKLNRLKIKKVYATIKDDVLKLKVGKLKASLVDNVWQVEIPLRGKGVKEMGLTFYLPKANEPIISPSSRNMKFEYSAKISSLMNQGDGVSHEIKNETLYPSFAYLDNFKILSKESEEINIIPKKQCPLKVKATRNLFLSAVDRERMYFSSIRVTGILNDKTIIIPRVFDSFHQHYIHDSDNIIAIDLFSDARLTELEKDEVDKYGRYMLIRLGRISQKNIFGKESFKETEFNGYFEFIGNDFNRKPELKNCSQYEE